MNVVDSTTTDTARSAETTDQAQCRQIKFFSFVLLTLDHRESEVFETGNNIESPLDIGLLTHLQSGPSWWTRNRRKQQVTKGNKKKSKYKLSI